MAATPAAMLGPGMAAASAVTRAHGDPSQHGSAPYQNVAYGNSYGTYSGTAAFPPPAYPPTYAAGYPPPPGGNVSPGMDPYTGQPVYQQNEQIYGKLQNQNVPYDYPIASPATQADSDLEAQQEVMEVTENLSVRIRHAFVRKVYAILSVQLLVTFGIALCFSVVTPMREWILQYWWVSLIAVLAALIITIVMSCVPSIGRKVPLNFFLLSFITLCYSMVIGFAAAATSSEAFAIAAGITFVVAIGLTIFACQTKWDFTGLGVYLFVGVLVLLLFGIVAAILHTRVMQIVYAALGALLFSFMLVYDTQQIVGGKHRKYQYSIDDYIFAALTLYLDVVNLFLYILSLVSASGQ